MHAILFYEIHWPKKMSANSNTYDKLGKKEPKFGL